MHEYRLLRGDVTEIQVLIEKHAREGWRVVGFTAGGGVDLEFFALLERGRR